MTTYCSPTVESALRLDTANRAIKGITKKQREALEWLWPNSRRQWQTMECGDPAIGSLDSLVRRGLATKIGSSGWNIYFELTDTGRLARSLLPHVREANSDV
jgi:hypothetical protein